jgi:hypothetical protein
VRGLRRPPNALSADGLATLAQPAARQADVLVVDQRDRQAIPAEVAAISGSIPSPHQPAI